MASKLDPKQTLSGIVAEWRGGKADITKKYDAGRLGPKDRDEQLAALDKTKREDLVYWAKDFRDDHRKDRARIEAALMSERKADSAAYDWAKVAVLRAEYSDWAHAVADLGEASQVIADAIAIGDREVTRSLNAAVAVLQKRAATDPSLTNGSGAIFGGSDAQGKGTVLVIAQTVADANTALRSPQLAKLEADLAAQDAFGQKVESAIGFADMETAVVLGRGVQAPGVLADAGLLGGGLFANGGVVMPANFSGAMAAG